LIDKPLRIAELLTEDNALDHRSYERQGVDKIPTVHLGVAVTQMERRGIATERGDINCRIEVTKSKLRQIKARLDKLDNWLADAKENTTPTLYDTFMAIADAPTGNSRYNKIRHIKLMSKTLLFIQENNISTIEDLRRNDKRRFMLFGCGRQAQYDKR
jgi:hypothetical protein